MKETKTIDVLTSIVDLYGVGAEDWNEVCDQMFANKIRGKIEIEEDRK